jgi:putative ABC transport system permease protein
LLLVVAALLTRSFIAAQRTNPGFAVKYLATVSTDTSTLGYTPAEAARFYDQAIAKVSAIPGVESVALATRVPMQLNPNRWEIWIPGRHQPGVPGDTVEVTTVSPEYFRTLGVGIVEGRAFTSADRRHAARGDQRALARQSGRACRSARPPTAAAPPPLRSPAFRRTTRC